MFYSFKNVPITINGVFMAANSVGVTEGSSNESIYKVGQRHSFEFAPTNGILGNMTFSYYMTGEDSLKTFIENERTVLSGNIGGLYFETGYLTSYSVNMTPNTPIVVDAQIVFFDDLKGLFCANYSVVSSSNVLNFSNVEIENLNTCSIGVIDSITQINYRFNSQVEPIYKISDYKARGVAFGQKNIAIEINTDNLAPDLSIYGKKAGIRVNLKHPSLPNINENLTCSGILHNRAINTKVDEVLESVLSIKQSYIYSPPSITGFDPQTQVINGYIYVSGTNLINTRNVYLNSLQNNSVECSSFKVINDNLVYVQVADTAFSGPITIENHYGRFTTSGILVVQYPTTSIT
jgi:hypothetical protein